MSNRPTNLTRIPGDSPLLSAQIPNDNCAKVKTPSCTGFQRCCSIILFSVLSATPFVSIDCNENSTDPKSFYALAGLISYKQSGLPAQSADGVTIRLDDRSPQAVNTPTGPCSFTFPSVIAGKHRLRIDGPMIIRVDTVLDVQRGSDCSTFSPANCNFEIVYAPKVFTLPMTVGTTWQYFYKSGNSDPSPRYDFTQGTHTWTISSVSMTTSDTTLHITDVMEDSVTHQTQTIYTAYAQRSVRTFDIVLSADWVSFGNPESGPTSISRRVSRYTDTVSVSSGDNLYSTTTYTYVNGTGIAGFRFWAHGATSIYTTNFQLIQLSPK